ncbi:TerC family protein [Desertimonas flava]|uniref:TerC family protein n=1 Tax=Desertimonas flava TaxID=2064846 RepID=UPI000E350164|nr:TerC family protein [Desertimonas flava]
MFLIASSDRSSNFVDINVHAWQWLVLLGLIVALLLVDLLVFHREAHEINTKEAAIESAAWISVGVAFSLVVLWWFGGAATGEYVSGYLIEKSLSIDNVFVWALLMSYFKVPQKYQHRVLFWGIFGALVMRAIFIFAGVAIIERFEWVLYIFGAFLLFTAGRMLVSGDDEVDPGNSKVLKLVNRIVPSTDKLDGPHLFTKVNGKRLATPLFAVLLLVEATDVVFAVDSVPAVLAVSHEQFLVFSSNAFAILGLRALYFLLADLHNRFKYLQTGLAIILAFVGVKMILSQAPLHYHMPTWISLPVIGLILAVSIIVSLKATPDPDDHFPHQIHDEAGPADDARTDGAVAEAVGDATDDDPATDPTVTGDHA